MTSQIKRLRIKEPSHQIVTQAIRNTQENLVNLQNQQTNGTIFNINGLTANHSPATTDYFPYYNASAAANVKCQFSDIPNLSWTMVKKTADQSVTSSTAYVSDNHLFFSVSSATRYTWRMAMFFGASAGGGSHFQFTGPASPTFLSIAATGYDSVATAGQYVTAFSTEINNPSQTNHTHLIYGYLHNGANAGTVTLQWAQQASNSTATTLQQGSYLEWMKV